MLSCGGSGATNATKLEFILVYVYTAAKYCMNVNRMTKYKQHGIIIGKCCQIFVAQ